ncbi:hypothetical protein BCR36DRAFT_396701 [Piromyces finnis]|uniref:Uncharacterized protein n=1 Tax=Piromyces finnis TaxID=1754191 RepID=A0A1Y1VDT6_9FUNG|nr:hypothetical protein BCR36DRAFT_396701 [Piromyces finnis]|eukprot:ORX52903.1 hypothetical protein BCR36DRAFT_396701 [Piromyces finnis]
MPPPSHPIDFNNNGMEYEPLQRGVPNNSYHNGPQGYNNKNYTVRRPMPYKPYSGKDGHGGRGRGGRRHYGKYHNNNPNMYGPPPSMDAHMNGMAPEMTYHDNPMLPPTAYDFYGNPIGINSQILPNPVMRPPPMNPMTIDYGSSENDHGSNSNSMPTDTTNPTNNHANQS